MKSIAAAVAVGLVVFASAAPAGARAYKGYWFRVSHYTLNATAAAEGTETGASGTPTSGHAVRTATIDYTGRRGDVGVFNELPRNGYPGDVSVGRTVPMEIHQTGSWTVTSEDGSSSSGTCHGDRSLRPFEPYSQIHRARGKLSGKFDAPIVDDGFDDGCALNPGLGSPHFPWTLPVSAFRRRVVKIPLRYDFDRAGGIHYAVHWTGTVTLRRIKVCRTSKCAASIR